MVRIGPRTFYCTRRSKNKAKEMEKDTSRTCNRLGRGPSRTRLQPAMVSWPGTTGGASPSPAPAANTPETRGQSIVATTPAPEAQCGATACADVVAIVAPAWLEYTTPDGRLGIVRADETADLEDVEEIEPPPPCSTCGSLMAWWDVLGGQHCMVCEAAALARSRRLAARATELKQQYQILNTLKRKAIL